MADPLSIAGLATGVISLGLQVAGGLVDYLDAVKARPEELSSAKQQATNMKDLLLTIQDLLPQVESGWPASATTIERHVKSCDTELSALYALLFELSQPSTPSSSIRLRLAEQKKKLTYPFNRSHISRVEDRLAKVNSALQTALQVTQLNVSITTGNQIRQVHDALLTLSQPQAMRTQSAVTRLSLTMTGEKPEKVASQSNRSPLDSIDTTLSLVSKPSLLSTSIEELAKYNALQVPRGDMSYACTCRPSRIMSRHRSTWRYFSFHYETSSINKHLPGCLFSQIYGDEKASKITVEYSGLRRLFQKAVILSFLTTHGAGGRSISPSFTYYPSVNEYTAPAFMIMRLVYYMVCLSLTPSTKETVAKVIQLCFDGVLMLYRRGKASPKDIDSTGMSLLGLALRPELQHSLEDSLTSDAILSGIKKLITSGVPVATYNIDGETPCGNILINVNVERQDAFKLIKLLTSAAPDIPLYLTKPQKFLQGRCWACLDVLKQDLTIAEATGCGPLSLAAIAGNERIVQDLICREPQTLEEVNEYDHTPIHFAVYHPSCLRLIAKASKPSILDKVDVSHGSPLEYACKKGCTESVQILLASGARITHRCITRMAEPCWNDVLVALKQRRNELKMLAMQNLPGVIIESFGLHECKVLDSSAFEVQKLLQRRGVKIPSHMYIKDIEEVTGDYAHTSVYQKRYGENIPITDIFDKLWALGFRETDSFHGASKLPLIQHWLDAEAARWLIEHGADYWTPLSERSAGMNITESATPAHFIFAGIGKARCRDGYRWSYLIYPQLEKWLVEKLLQVQASDTCCCQCSVDGCTPLKAFLDAISFKWVANSDGRAPPPTVACKIVKFIHEVQPNFNEEHLIAAVRYMTFQALDFTHSCCRFSHGPRGYEGPRHTSEEMDELQLEQSTLLSLFADLLTEFERIAYEDRNGTPLIISDPEEFWIKRWLPRITEVLDGLDGNDITEEEKLAAEAVGVVWGPQPAKTAYIVEWPEPTPEYVISKLEKIMNE